jgi:hypothetical protein
MAGQPTLATTGAGQLIPNRHAVALDATERLAEAADRRRLSEAARETGNWSLVGVLVALSADARERRQAAKGKRA